MLLMVGWLVGAILLRRDALWILIIPLLTANLTLMCYISTQHWFRPLVDHDDPVATTISVRAPRMLDWWHFQFSYHQEHHLFPKMSHRYGPALRRRLLEIEPDAVAVLPWTTALKAVFTTPAIYGDASTLVHEDGSHPVDLLALAAQLELPVVDGTALANGDADGREPVTRGA